MSSKRTTLRRTAMATVAMGAAVGATVAVLPGAQAAAPAKTSPAALSATASHLKAALGGNEAGSYLENGKLVVNVVHGQGADQVRAAGAVPRTVTHSTAQLNAATRVLSKDAKVAGTAWMIDPKTNRVRVLADKTVTGGKLDTVKKAVRGLGDKAALKQTKGEFKPLLAGGDAIYGGGYRCSVGFNVKVGGASGFLTAGHCGNVASSWSDSQTGSPVATTQDSTFPGHDYSLAKYSGGASAPSEVDLYNGSSQKITSAADATVGEQVKRSGSTTQVQSGQVTGLNATVNYQEGTVTGMIDTNVCAEGGDSGGALFDGSTALGLTSGGSGDCTYGGETFFQPVKQALDAYGASIG